MLHMADNPHCEVLNSLAARGRLRALAPRAGIDFTSNDFLGLAESAFLRAAAEEALARQDHEEERPFIEPARAGARRESAMTEAPRDGEAARIEPSFGVASPLDIPADIQAETTTPNGFTPESASAQASVAPTSEETPAEQADERVTPAATTISAAPPHIVDRRIDCVVPIRLSGPISGEKASPLAQRHVRPMSCRFQASCGHGHD